MEFTFGNPEEINFYEPCVLVQKLLIRYPDLVWEISDKDDTAYTDDPVRDKLVGLVTEDAVIFDLFSSECGRFLVNPEIEYGVAKDVAIIVNEYNKINSN